MSELPVVGFLCLRKDFWDHHGANIATCLKEIYGERFFWRPKNERWEKRQKSDNLTPRSFFWTSKQPFATDFFLASCKHKDPITDNSFIGDYFCGDDG